MIRPRIGFATAKLLQDAGCVVEVPVQTCCGQPAFNSGDRATARAIAESVIAAFEPYDYVVAPSGSCAGMLRVHYPELFAGDPNWMPRVETFCGRVYEIASFLVDVLKVERVNAFYEGTVTYHDGCSGLRELGIKRQPRQLLTSVAGLSLTEMKEPEVCCGFGGTFCVKYPEISNSIVEKKVANVAATGAPMLLAGDLGCLMNMAGKLQRMGSPVAVRHVVEVLAGMAHEPAIGEPAKVKRS
ncbi:MAG: (Fe-S)-binding protein [Xanthobacteraceae bacterium]|nr:(Fe-S)-binding protein [Xanthobacteraceae bacterium]